MDSNRRNVNIVMVIIVVLFLTLGFGGMAVYGFFSRDPQAAAPAASSTPTRLAASPSVTPSTSGRSGPGCTNDAAFVSDATVPNDADFQPRQEFEKTWRIKNSGTCAWNSGYKLAFVDGARMGAPAEIPVPDTAPGATADVKVKLSAPQKTGVSAGVWKMKSPNGEAFGPTLNLTVRVRAPGSKAACSGTPAIESFLANPTTIVAGQSSTLSWGMVSNADAAEIDNGIGGVATPGGLAVSPKTTTTYTLTARCGQATTQAQVTIVVR